MAAYLGEHAVRAETASTLSHVLTVGAIGGSVGNLVVVGCTHGSASGTFSIADSKSNTWTAGTRITTGAGGASSQLFWSVLTVALVTSDTITVTSSASSRGEFWAVGFSGSSGTSATVGDVATNGSSVPATTTISAGPTATSAGASIVVGYGAYATAAGTVVAGSGYTLSTTGQQASNSGTTSSLEYKITLSAAAETATFTIPSAAWQGIVQVFKATAAAEVIPELVMAPPIPT